MYDVELRMANRPGELARIGEALGTIGVSVEGGGMFLADGVGLAHFLVADGTRAVEALRAAGLEVVGVRDVVTLRLDQRAPGQLGAVTAAMAAAGVNIQCLYSDHDHRLILLTDRPAIAAQVSRDWAVS